MSDEICLIDTSILVYAYDESEGKKHEIGKHLIDECWRLKKKYSISIQNLSEFYVVITKKIEKPMPIETAKEIIGDIIEFQNWIVIDYDARTLLSAIEINISYTENGGFKSIPWLKVINPFEVTRD